MTGAEPPLKETPLHANHLALGARMVAYAGYEMPVQYTSIIEEHRTVRGAVGLFDLSHMGELNLSGPEALAFARYAVVSDPGLLEPGQAQYSMLCLADGGIIDDLIVYRLDDGYLIVCNAANHAAVRAHPEAPRPHGHLQRRGRDRPVKPRRGGSRGGNGGGKVQRVRQRTGRPVAQPGGGQARHTETGTADSSDRRARSDRRWHTCDQVPAVATEQ